MSDYDFKAASKDGYGEDWPISYADIAPYYDQVEEFLGVYGSRDDVRNLPNGKYFKTPKLTALEQAFKTKVEAEWPDRSVISWRYAAPNLKRVPLPIARRKGNRPAHDSDRCNCEDESPSMRPPEKQPALSSLIG